MGDKNKEYSNRNLNECAVQASQSRMKIKETIIKGK